MAEPRIIPCIAVVANNRLLLLQRGAESKYPHTWCIPGGKIEDGETDKQCAIRELREETGIDVDDLELLGDFESGTRDMDGKPYLLRVFVLRCPEGMKTACIGCNEDGSGGRPVVTVEPGFQGFGWFNLQQIVNVGAMAPAKRVAVQLGIEQDLG